MEEENGGGGGEQNENDLAGSAALTERSAYELKTLASNSKPNDVSKLMIDHLCAGCLSHWNDIKIKQKVNGLKVAL